MFSQTPTLAKRVAPPICRRCSAHFPTRFQSAMTRTRCAPPSSSRSISSSSSATTTPTTPTSAPATGGQRVRPPPMNTRLTSMLGIDYPIILGPMAHASDVTLTAAVSHAGGFGLLPGLDCGREYLETSIRGLNEACDGTPYGIGFHVDWLKYSLGKGRDEAAAERALKELEWLFKLNPDERPKALFFSFGAEAAFAERAREAGFITMTQIQTVDQARRAAPHSDVIIAQSTSAGGHAGRIEVSNDTIGLLPAVMDAVGVGPLVVAAGGISEGRGMAGVIAMGADGVLVGTRFCATPESLLLPRAKEMLVEASFSARSGVYDLVRPTAYGFAKEIDGRGLVNEFTERWWHQEEALVRDGGGTVLERERETFQTKVREAREQAADPPIVWAGSGVASITGVLPAQDIVFEMVSDAQSCLKRSYMASVY